MIKLAKSLRFILLIVFAGLLCSFKPYDYNAAWKKVEAVGKDKPKTALNKINDIRKQAVADKNQLEQLNCILNSKHYNEKVLGLSRPAAKICLKELNAFLLQQKDPVMVALTRYALAQNYRVFRQGTVRNTELADTIPDDVEEWPHSLVGDTVESLARLTLNEPVLRKALCKDYKALVYLQKNDNRCKPTLFDVMVYATLQDYGLEDDFKLQILSDLVDLHRGDADRLAYVMARIRQINLNGNSLAQYRDLLEEVKNCEASVLVRVEIAHKLDFKFRNGESQDISPDSIFQICNEGIKAYPNSPHIRSLEGIVESLSRELLDIKRLDGGVVHAGDRVRLAVSYANITNLKLSLQRYDCEPEDFAKKRHKNLPVAPVTDYSFNLTPSNYYLMRDTIIEIPAPEFGDYRIAYGNKFLDFVVSNHFVLDLGEYIPHTARKQYNDYLLVVDNKTGAPLPQVNVQNWKYYGRGLYSSKWVFKRDSALTNELGLACFCDTAWHEGDTLSLRSGKDRYFFCNRYGFSRNGDIYYYDKVRLDVFTDRSIYRPGQMVHFKAIVYKNSHLGKLYKNKRIPVEITDANDQTVKEFELKTDRFGAIADSFALPTSCRPGSFRIRVGRNDGYDAYSSFRVEEYKRPTFEITLKRPQGAFTYGDSVKIEGTAAYLMGASLQNVKVRYAVNCLPTYFWWLRSDNKYEKNTEEGETLTDDNGNFVIAFVPRKTSTGKAFNRYLVEVTITDANGETRMQSGCVQVGDEGLVILSPESKQMQLCELPSQMFRVVNLNCEGVDREVTYTISREGVEVAKGSVMADKEKGFTLPIQTDSWQSGRYVIRLSVTDDRHQVISREMEVALYRKTDQCPPVECALWTENMGKHIVGKGDTIAVRVGTTLHNAHLLVMEIDTAAFKWQWVDLDNEIKTFKYTLATEYAAQVQFYLVHDGKLETEKLELVQKLPERIFPMQLSVFRDKAMPGSKQHWRITIPADSLVAANKVQHKHADKKHKKHKHKKHKKTKDLETKKTKSPVQVLASMYDASLDQINPHEWSFSPEYRCTYWFNSWKNCTMKLKKNKIHRTEDDYMWEELGYYDIDDDDEEWTTTLECRAESKQVSLKDAASESSGSAAETDYLYRIGQKAEKKDEQPTARHNFSETAFFYPKLYADRKGRVSIDFTMPESLTKWKLQALAHGMALDAKSHQPVLRYSYLAQEMVSQQDFTISPNYPRFLRQGDHGIFTAKIINLSDKEQKGVATVEWLDPVTERVVAKRDTAFNVAAHQNGVVEWTLDVPHNTEALLMRVSAKGANLSDAEQQLLPVLTDRVVLTQTLPMFVRGGQTKQYELTNLAQNNSSTLSSRFLKLEMTTNPVWDAIQCLPTLAEPRWNDAISYSSAYFATQMAQAIVEDNPRIFDVIGKWKKQDGDKQTLVSNLMKNDEVKQVLLSETPWVMEAQDETQRKERLSLLLDVDFLQSNSEKMQQELKNQYNANDGGYGWFRGMPSSRYLSLYVLDNFGRLIQDGIKLDEYDARIHLTIDFIDKEQQKRYEELKEEKRLDKYWLSSSDLYYLQVRSLFFERYPCRWDRKDVYDYFYQQAKKQWHDCSLRGKAMAATVLFRGGDTLEARNVVASLREYATTTDEMGMYWPSNNSGWLWEDDAIATHTAIMEALQLVDANQEEQDNLRIWLLNQKRTQDWGNTIATVDALHVLLRYGTNWTIGDNKVTVKQGGTLVTPDKEEDGTGYFSQTVSGSDITPNKAKIELTSQAGGNIAFGGLYWQFEEDMDKVKQGKAGLSVDKMVTLKVSQDGAEVLQPVRVGTPLKVGDQLVMRLTVRADRDFEYVMLKDQRASCLEPVQTLSGYHFDNVLCYYQSVKDASMCYFFDRLPKGTYILEYPVNVTHCGTFSNGITTLQCLYAPEFSANTGSVRIKVEGR